jgi:tyrosyl-tRNA synthetase
MKNIFHQSSFHDIEPCKFYLGIDPTSTKLHIGHFYLLKVCEYLVSQGFEMILLIGDKTAMIGDPTDKNRTRNSIEKDVILSNIKSITEQIPSFKYKIIFNSMFEHDIELFKHFSVSNLLTNKTFSNRLENKEGLSLLEFIYPVIQGLDFYYLRKQYDVKLQIGGQDQWFNMVTGLNFIKKEFNDCNIATLPLIVTNKGEKIGKTVNKVEMNSWETWQFFRNIKDEYIKPIYNSIGGHNDDKNINDLKIEIANTMVAFIYSEQEAMICNEEANNLFKKIN